MTLVQLLSVNNYPRLKEFVERLQIRAEVVNTIDGQEASELLDEIRHLAVRAFNASRFPS